MAWDNRSFYVRGLRWAFNKGSAGFTDEEIKRELGLDDDGWALFQWMFMSSVRDIAPLIWRPAESDLTPQQLTGPRPFYLTAAGISAYNEHVELEEAKRSGRNAMKIAILSIIVSAAFGFLQVMYQTNGTFKFQYPECRKYLDSFTATVKAQEDFQLKASSGTSENFWVAYSPKINSCIGGYDVLAFDTNGKWKRFQIDNVSTNTKIDALAYAFDDKVVDAGMTGIDVVNKMNKEVSDLTKGNLTNVFSLF